MSQKLSRFHLSCITHGGTTMNSEERQSIEGKRREERKADQFLKRNHVNERRQTLISLSSLVLPSLLPVSRGRRGWRLLGSVGDVRIGKEKVTVERGKTVMRAWAVTVAGRGYCSCVITVAVMGKFWTTHNFLIRILNYACE
jgi:hypothetical protein